MGVEYFDCPFCGETICDSGDFSRCDMCEEIMCEECGDNRKKHGKIVCDYCLEKTVSDDDMIEFLLEKCELSREEAVKLFYKGKTITLPDISFLELSTIVVICELSPLSPDDYPDHYKNLIERYPYADFYKKSFKQHKNGTIKIASSKKNKLKIVAFFCNNVAGLLKCLDNVLNTKHLENIILFVENSFGDDMKSIILGKSAIVCENEIKLCYYDNFKSANIDDSEDIGDDTSDNDEFA